MRGKKTLQKCMAMMLSFVMVVGLTPISVMAETGGLTVSESGEIISFAQLTPEITAQTVPLGTSESKLSLPETLMAEVRLSSAAEAEETPQEEQVQDSGEPQQAEETETDEQNTLSVTDSVYTSTTTDSALTLIDGDEPEQDEQQDTGETDVSEPVAMAVSVTWTASPEYNGDAADEYIFTPTLLEGFTLADGVSLPTITVTVEQAASYGEITAFDALADELRWQNTVSPILPETVSGTVAGEATDIPVTWEADHKYDADSPAKGLYVFTAKVSSGNTVADGVESPRITVYIPAVQQRLRLMAGAGTSDSALEITTAAQLAEIATLVNAGRLETFLFNDSEATVYLRLGNDIDLSDYGESWNDGEGWIPIGTKSHHFKGMFDGGGNTITGLYINNSSLYNNTGLFGYMDGSTVQDLGLVDVNITDDSNYIGGVAGFVYNGSITNCYAIGTITGFRCVGGIVGSFSSYSGSITYCYATGTVTGSETVGGVVGEFRNHLNGSSSITNCYASGEVIGGGSGYFGGVAGSVYNGSITNCYSTCTVSGNNDVSGVVGDLEMDSKMQDCVALNLSVSGRSFVGRVAYADYGTLSGNAAFSGMTVTENSAPKSIISDAGGIDGADMDAAAIKADGSLGGRFTEENGWTVENGKLPGIGKAAEIPDYIMGGSDPIFLGKGTPENPYQISTAAQLAKLAELVNAGDTNYNAKYYKLTADIDLSVYNASNTGFNGGKGWIPIGTNYNHAFVGSFDGNEKTITGLFINNSALYNVGLFGYVKNGTVQKLGVMGASITGDSNIGGVSGFVYNGSVTNCYATGTVTGSKTVGGVVGFVYGGSTVQYCYATGTVTGSETVGGVAGDVSMSSLQNCYSTGTVNGNLSVGGISGCAIASSSLTNCAALNPSVNCGSNVGRVVGLLNSGTLSGNCAFSGMTVNGSTVSSDDAASLNGADKDAAAIAGASFFQNLFGNDSAWIYADGKLPILAGFAEGTQDAVIPYYISGSYFGGGDGSSEAQAYKISTAAQLAKLAELVNARDINYFYGKCYKLTADIDLSGYNASNTGFNAGKGWVPIGMKNYYFHGTFDGNGHTITGLYINNNNLSIAGLFGYMDGSTVKNLSVTGAEITGKDLVGGVAGHMVDTSVTNCYVTGTVTGNNFVGSISGSNSRGNMNNCYSTGAVNGNYYVGGVVGNSDCVTNCYSTGAVNGNSIVGGVVGYIESGCITNCYSTGAVSGNGIVGGVVGKNSGGVTSCIALNPNVSGSINIGCVVGQNLKTLSGNYAFSGITGGGSDKTASGLDGADITVSQINTASFWIDAGIWGTSGWDSAFWTIQDGKLPILKNVGGVQSGDSGLYLTMRDIQYADIGTGASYTYTGSLITPVVKFDGATLVKDEDYEVSITSIDGEGTSAGTQTGIVSLTISGKGNFSGTESVTYIINKAPAPTLVWPVAASITFGNTLSDSALTGGSAAYGSFAWTDGDTVPPVGNGSYSVTFTPNAATAANYEAITETSKTVEITVNKAPAPALSWPVAASITYGDTLSDSVLTGGSTAYGSFEWTNGDTVPTVENSGYGVTFTPSAATTANYEAITETIKAVEITVNKAPAPSLVWPASAAVTYGAKLSDSALTGGSTVYGSFAWTNGNTIPTVENSGYSVTFTPNAATTENYEAITETTKTMEITVNKAPAPNLVWPAAATVTYGDTLSDSALTGGSTAYGSFAWTDGNTVLTVGNSGYSVTFTPSAATAANYEAITETTRAVQITVNKAPAPTLSPQTISIYRGTASTGNTIDLAALLPADRGTTSYSVTSSNTLVQHVSVNAFGHMNFDILSSDSVTTENVTVEVEMRNYEDAVLTVTVSFVNKKVPVVTPSVSGSLSYGQPLSTLTTNATALEDNGSTPVSGSIVWNDPSSKPAVGAPAQSWTFTPSDTGVYEIVTGTAAITVNKAAPQGTPAITQISIPGKTLFHAVLTGSFTNPYDGSPISGTLNWDLPDTTAVTHGTAYNWTFTPDDTTNYSVRTGSLTPYLGSTGGDSSSGGSSDSDSPVTPVTKAPEKRPDQPVTASVSITAVGTKDTVGAAIPDKVITDAIAKAQSEAKAQGKTADGISVALNITAPQGTSTLSATLSQTALKALVDASVTSLEINCLPVNVSFDQKALRTIQSQSSGNVTITAATKKDILGSAKTMIGTRPVYNITVSYTANGSAFTMTNLSGGTATVSIPYTPAQGESAGYLYGVYVDGSGNATRIDGSSYDANSGCLIFNTGHLSIYGVGYTAPSAKFTDISGHWAKDAIDYVVGRGLLSGTSDTIFSPDIAMTRGMLVTALGRLAGVDAKLYTANSFTDVKAGSAFQPYIEWAYQKGIVQGIGGGQFAPDRAVTREEIAVILQNYAKATGYTLPVTRVAVTFADSSSIGNAYKDAVTAMQQAGIMLGENNNKFSPKAGATRAEVAAMLTRYIKLTIDPATAQGWAKNDSGQWMYFKDGKALIGWQTINGKIYCFDSSGGAYANGWRQNSQGEWFYLTADGSAARDWKDIGGHRYYFGADAVMIAGKWLEIDGKWYYFYADGFLARSTTIDGYKVDENGARKVE
ncbi:GLUG motif-containing protein [Faecalispora anaeroviscerum]|uniref:GLUG motif-containing protein n=1 Tax=Faecalispora anaeroviscerum TaxID=2991836 RepID=UPI0024B9264E|nr:GLUG motif-containing protein [Faecalispora anaeroviscerum]